MGTRLAWSSWAIFAVPLLWVIYLKLKLKTTDNQKPIIYFPNLSTFTTRKNSLKVKAAAFPHLLKILSLVLFSLALINPRLIGPRSTSPEFEKSRDRETVPTEGIAIYLVLDRSGSMRREVVTWSEELGKRTLPKMELLKEVTEKFILGNPQSALTGRPNDLIGLVVFARTANILSPLTLDHSTLVSRIRELKAIDDPQHDGTGIGYALFKTVNTIVATRHFGEELAKEGKPNYNIESQVIVLVTDGLQSFNQEDAGSWLRQLGVEEAAAYAKENGTKLYIINIEPSLAREEFAPHRKQMERAAESTGGQFFMATAVDNLEAIYREINFLEKSSLPTQAQLPVAPISLSGLGPNEELKFDPFMSLVLLGILSLGMSWFLATTYLARIP